MSLHGEHAVDHLDDDGFGALVERHVDVHAGVGGGATASVRVGDEVAEDPVEARLG